MGDVLLPKQPREAFADEAKVTHLTQKDPLECPNIPHRVAREDRRPVAVGFVRRDELSQLPPSHIPGLSCGDSPCTLRQSTPAAALIAPWKRAHERTRTRLRLMAEARQRH
ncbi:hypothetical protein HPB48_002328 [Haemaphysalis longicornis]|uniref:Uncharacterized protein n=1 Tax=Haemaphysalis longicornis TaxID=44386 RepID=A0A9J6FSR3_HAELO|nr:hypothetical protein HPB48_002328 [Haemaphysalis longicornis]